MNTNLKFVSTAFLMLSCASLSAERDFIFAENPNHNNVVLQKVAAAVPYRLLSTKDPEGFSFELDDGSTWRVVGYDGIYAVKEWRINDSLVIFPCLFPTWTGARFYVFNERTRTTANVEISFGPTRGMVTHNQIFEINFVQGIVFVMDGAGNTAQWIINRNDMRTLQNWKIGQTIILGFMENSYAGWFSHESYILINVEAGRKGEFVEANLL